jgi:hypothetical protein
VSAQRALSRARLAWIHFFHAPVDPRPLAVLRVFYAALVLVYLGTLLPQANLFWAETGTVSPGAARDLGGLVPTVFAALPRSSGVLRAATVVALIQAALLLVGYRTRLQSISTFVWLVSFQNLNLLILNGQDAALRLMGLFLIFLPVGGAFSLDARKLAREALPRAARVAAIHEVPRIWPLRLLQAQFALIVLSAGLWKLRGDDWVDGTALYYVTRLEGFWGNLPVPAFVRDSLLASKVLSWSTLAVELGAPIAVWFRPTRRAAVAVAVGFHLALAYAMNLFLFEWIMVAGWCAFLEWNDFAALARFACLPWRIHHEDDTHPRPRPLPALE